MTYCIDFLTIILTDFAPRYLVVISLKTFPICMKSTSLFHALQMPSPLSIFELQAIVQEPVNIIWCNFSECLMCINPFGGFLTLQSFHAAESKLVQKNEKRKKERPFVIVCYLLMPMLFDSCPSALGLDQLSIVKRNICQVLICVIIGIITKVWKILRTAWVACCPLRTR